MKHLSMTIGQQPIPSAGPPAGGEFFSITPEVLLFIGGAVLSLVLVVFFLVFMIVKLREEQP